MKVFKQGTPVIISPRGNTPPLFGTVTAVTIRGQFVTYEVAWWSGNTRNCMWLEEFEVQPSEGMERRHQIGFHA